MGLYLDLEFVVLSKVVLTEVFLYAYFMNRTEMRGLQSPPKGCIFGLITILLGLILTASTASYQREHDPTCHGGGLSAGFPLPFLCDDTAGSPVSSWQKIDLADWFNINPRIFLLDFLLWNALLSLAWIALTGLFRREMAQNEYFRWAVMLCLGYIIAFLFAFVSFQSSYLNFEVPVPRTPTPFIPTATPFGAPPPSDVAPTSSP
jgi:hypothetical protein